MKVSKKIGERFNSNIFYFVLNDGLYHGARDVANGLNHPTSFNNSSTFDKPVGTIDVP